jgi:hypothetical protein
MKEHEAIVRAETWYLQRYHAVARGHFPPDIDRRALREDAFLCIDLVPEQEAEVVKVLLDLTGEEVVLLEEGRPCPRCISSKRVGHQGWLLAWMRWGVRPSGKRR